MLQRYWSDQHTPRPESYRVSTLPLRGALSPAYTTVLLQEDVEAAGRAAAASGRDVVEVFADLAAGAESGWDYSARWLQPPPAGGGGPWDMATIRTMQVIPVRAHSTAMYTVSSSLAPPAPQLLHPSLHPCSSLLLQPSKIDLQKTTEFFFNENLAALIQVCLNSIMHRLEARLSLLCAAAGDPSHCRRGCHSTGIPSPSVLKDLLKAEGGAAE